MIWFLYANNERKKIAKLVKEFVNDILLKWKNSKFDRRLNFLIFHIFWKKKQFQELREMSKVSDFFFFQIFIFFKFSNAHVKS